METSAAALQMQSQTPIFLYNGLKDDSYLYNIVTASYEYFVNTIYKSNPDYYEAKSQDIGHTWSQESLVEGKVWLDKYTKPFDSST